MILRCSFSDEGQRCQREVPWKTGRQSIVYRIAMTKMAVSPLAGIFPPFCVVTPLSAVGFGDVVYAIVRTPALPAPGTGSSSGGELLWV
jgi:hypothetical protein